jgi:hypothetical protein
MNRTTELIGAHAYPVVAPFDPFAFGPMDGHGDPVVVDRAAASWVGRSPHERYMLLDGRPYRENGIPSFTGRGLPCPLTRATRTDGCKKCGTGHSTRSRGPVTRLSDPDHGPRSKSIRSGPGADVPVGRGPNGAVPVVGFGYGRHLTNPFNQAELDAVVTRWTSDGAYTSRPVWSLRINEARASRLRASPAPPRSCTAINVGPPCTMHRFIDGSRGRHDAPCRGVFRHRSARRPLRSECLDGGPPASSLSLLECSGVRASRNGDYAWPTGRVRPSTGWRRY